MVEKINCIDVLHQEHEELALAATHASVKFGQDITSEGLSLRSTDCDITISSQEDSWPRVRVIGGVGHVYTVTTYEQGDDGLYHRSHKGGLNDIGIESYSVELFDDKPQRATGTELARLVKIIEIAAPIAEEHVAVSFSEQTASQERYGLSAFIGRVLRRH